MANSRGMEFSTVEPAWLAFLWWQLSWSLQNLELFGFCFLRWIRWQVKPSWRRVLDRLTFEMCTKDILWQ